MTNLDSEICLKLKSARRAAKLSQGVVAAEIGCTQSALSMFEQGDGTKLNAEIVGRLAKKFGVSLEPSAARGKSAAPEKASVIPPPPSADRGFCPNPHCPTNLAYEVEGRTFLRPDRAAADPVGGRFCAMCGEHLEKRCPTCGAPVHDGAVCSVCGERYVSVLPGDGEDAR